MAGILNAPTKKEKQNEQRTPGFNSILGVHPIAKKIG
jgi:hypothetical protein